MGNLTITLDNDLLHKARIRAAELGTSVNAVLRDYLEEWTDRKAARQRAIERFLEASNVISTQVLLEFYVTVTRKLASPMAADEAERRVGDGRAIWSDRVEGDIADEIVRRAGLPAVTGVARR